MTIAEVGTICEAGFRGTLTHAPFSAFLGKDKEDITFKYDVHALGIVFFEMVMGTVHHLVLNRVVMNALYDASRSETYALYIRQSIWFRCDGRWLIYIASYIFR